MVPSWVLNALVIFIGSIIACYLGSLLPEYELFGAYILVLVIICTICAVTNNFPFLLALGLWTPIALPIPVFKSFPTFAIVLIWVGFILFFRLCLRGSLRYIKSYNILLLICFAWVPIRFLMNPIHKLGASVVGGSGVSGAMPYFVYVIAASTLVVLGAILNDRDTIIRYWIWSFRVVLVVGLLLSVCAFIPATAPFLSAMGMFAGGNMGDGIQRLVVLPGYGLFLLQAAFCPALFRLTRAQCVGVFTLGAGMMVVGGNRSAMAAGIIAVPILLFLHRRSHAMILSIALMIVGVGLLRFSVSQMASAQISPLVRSFGIFDSKIDDASGGSASANWRYAVWESAIGKIKEAPMVGRGFGNLPEHLDPTNAKKSTDFEVVLAQGEAHNGFITAAYAFGIPFTVAMTAAIFLYLFKHVKLALTTDKHDPELRDIHALLACTLATFPILIYTAFDISVTVLWLYVGLGIILTHLPRRSAVDLPTMIQNKLPSSNEQPFRLLPSHSPRP